MNITFLSRKRRASEITKSFAKESPLNVMHSSDNGSNDPKHQTSMTEDLFLDEYAETQYEDVESIISTLEYLNLNHTNFEK